MTFLITIVVGDLKQVFLIFSFLDSGIDTCYRKVLDLTLFLFTLALRIFLVVLVFFIGLVLIGKR